MRRIASHNVYRYYTYHHTKIFNLFIHRWLHEESPRKTIRRNLSSGEADFCISLNSQYAEEGKNFNRQRNVMGMT